MELLEVYSNSVKLTSYDSAASDDQIWYTDYRRGQMAATPQGDIYLACSGVAKVGAVRGTK